MAIAAATEEAARFFREYDARNAYWAASKPKPPYRSKRERPAEPLILTGHGVSLRVDRGTLVIRDGLTHATQAPVMHRFFKGDPSRPPRVIMLDGSGSLSFDVIAWLSEQDVPLFKVDHRGQVVSVIAGQAFYDPERVAWQIATRSDPAARLAFCTDLIATKLKASLGTLATAVPAAPARELAVTVASRELEAIAAGAFRDVDALRLSEARAASAYFAAWRSIPIAWRARSKHLVPPEWETVGTRRSMLASRNRHATHPMNAMLNYAYAVLHSTVQTELVAEGLDPARGIMHESRPGASAMVLDLMEPRRLATDAAVLRLLTGYTFSGADFTRTREGVCRLAPELARRVAGVAAIPT